MRIEKLTLNHKAMLYPRFKNMRSSISEHSFANLYLFREKHNYEVLFDQEIFIRGKTYENFTFLMPAFSIQKEHLDYLKSLLTEVETVEKPFFNGRNPEKGHMPRRGTSYRNIAAGVLQQYQVDFLFPISEELLGLFPAAEFSSTYLDADSDYVYSAEKISTYKGSRLHKKKNLLKQFTALYQYQARPLTNDLLADSRSILEAWQKESGEGPEASDYYPCQEALTLYEELILCGGIYYAENEPAGFIIGEELNPDTFLIHFAKARKKFKGIYQYMYNTFANILPQRYLYLNFEQDLGKEPLRLAKSSYQPEMMIKKYRVKNIQKSVL